MCGEVVGGGCNGHDMVGEIDFRVYVGCRCCCSWIKDQSFLFVYLISQRPQVEPQCPYVSVIMFRLVQQPPCPRRLLHGLAG